MKKRNPTLPRSEKTIREWEDDTGWCYELCQRPNGTYVLYASDGDNWRIESADTIKACLAYVKQPDEEILWCLGFGRKESSHENLGHTKEICPPCRHLPQPA
jgi:hypothetical protein